MGTWPRLERSTSGKQTPAQPTPCSKTPKNGHSAKAPIVDATILTVGTPSALARNLWLIQQADHRGQAVHPTTAQIRASPVRSNRSTLRMARKPSIQATLLQVTSERRHLAPSCKPSFSGPREDEAPS